MPDAYDATIPEVFPDRAPGSFSWVPEACGGDGGWVWTTFWPYQWDLDYTNPAVTLAMLGEITWLANRGVDVFRMDAVPFMWKRLGTNCQNQPEGHRLLQLLHALTRLAAPGVVFKAEAIVSPEDLVPYLGGHERYRPECELAYHNQLMVMLWSSLATEDARLAAHALGRMRPIPPTDVVGDLRARPRRHRLGGQRHRRRRRRGQRLRPSALPQRLLRRPLPGVVRPRRAVPGERGHRRRPHLRQRRRRCAASRTPWSGATTRRWSRASAGWCCSTPSSTRSAASRCCTWATSWRCATTPATSPTPSGRRTTAGCTGRRWTGRPPSGARPGDARGPGVRRGCSGSGRPAGRCPRCAAAVSARVLDVGNDAVLAWRRRHPRSGTFVGLANFSRGAQTVDADTVTGFGTFAPVLTSDGTPELRADRLLLPGLGFAWFAEP